MQLTVLVQNEEGDCLNLTVTPDMTLGVVKSLVEHDAKIPTEKQKLFYNDRALTDDEKTLEAEGIADGDLLTVHEFEPTQRRKRPDPPNHAERLRLTAMENPAVLAKVRAMHPALAENINDEQKFHEVYKSLNDAAEREKEEKYRLYERLDADPFDVEAQKKIEEIIRLEAVRNNWEMALEQNPEFFGRVVMLFIPVEVNNVKINAFVDSGAQATIMSPDCAERCGIMRLNDTRFAGEARGVGTAKILGRVHRAQIKIGKNFLISSFTVMEGKDVDLLLGLDMLRRHQATIDLQKNVLRIDNDETPFLSEGELPRIAFGLEEPVVQGPGGLQVGGRSGAILAPGSEQQVAAGPSSSALLEGHATPEQPQQQASSIPQKRAANPTQEQPQQQTRSNPAFRFPKEHIDQLMSMGFSEAEVLGALELAGGNPDVAAGILYG